MRNLIFSITICCVAMMTGCTAPCSGCRHCSYTTAATPCRSCDYSSFTPGHPLAPSNCGPSGCGQMACAEIGCAVGSFAASFQPACGAPTEQCATEPAWNAPTLSGGGHCGQSGSCANKILLDWQQSTGVDDVVCSAPIGCACGSSPASNEAKMGCGCSAGGRPCECSTAVNSTAIIQPFVATNLATDIENQAPTSGSNKANGPVEARKIESTEDVNATDDSEVLPPPIDDESSSAAEPLPPHFVIPLHRSVEGIPVEGYPGKGCPVQRHATSPEKQDVSSLPILQPRSGLRGVLLGGGFDTNGIRKRKLVVQQVSQTAAPQRAEVTSEPKPKSLSPFDWMPKPRVRIESEGWSATPRENKVPVSTTNSKPVSLAKPPTAADEGELLPIPGI